MSKHPVKHERGRMSAALDVRRESLQQKSASCDDSHWPLIPASRGPSPAARVTTFTSFRYASAEISFRGDKAHVTARGVQWEDGKLSSEAFEGDVDPTVYEQAVLQAQRYFIGQTALFLQSLTSFLPFAGKRSRDRD